MKFANVNIKLADGTRIMLRNLNARLQRTVKKACPQILKRLSQKYLISEKTATLWLQELHKYFLILCHLNSQDSNFVPSDTLQKTWKTYQENSYLYRHVFSQLFEETVYCPDFKPGTDEFVGSHETVTNAYKALFQTDAPIEVWGTSHQEKVEENIVCVNMYRMIVMQFLKAKNPDLIVEFIENLAKDDKEIPERLSYSEITPSKRNRPSTNQNGETTNFEQGNVPEGDMTAQESHKDLKEILEDANWVYSAGPLLLQNPYSEEFIITL